MIANQPAACARLPRCLQCCLCCGRRGLGCLPICSNQTTPSSTRQATLTSTTRPATPPHPPTPPPQMTRRWRRSRSCPSWRASSPPWKPPTPWPSSPPCARPCPTARASWSTAAAGETRTSRWVESGWLAGGLGAVGEVAWLASPGAAAGRCGVRAGGPWPHLILFTSPPHPAERRQLLATPGWRREVGGCSAAQPACACAAACEIDGCRKRRRKPHMPSPFSSAPPRSPTATIYFPFRFSSPALPPPCKY